MHTYAKSAHIFTFFHMPPSNPVTPSPADSAPLSHFLCYCCHWRSARHLPLAWIATLTPQRWHWFLFHPRCWQVSCRVPRGFPMAFTIKPKHQLGLTVPGVPPLLWGCQMPRVFLHLVILPSCFSFCYILLPLCESPSPTG